MIGGVVPVVNVPGVQPGQLVLTGPLPGRHLPGQDRQNWNDKAIADLNPKVTLPNIDIAVVRRADGSGTSFIFTIISPGFRGVEDQVGEGTAVQWPTGMGAKGNKGVAAFLQRIPNSIGCVEYAYAKQNKLAHVMLKNAASNVVGPDDLTFKGRRCGCGLAQVNFGEILTNQNRQDAWPITGATFILMHRSRTSRPKLPKHSSTSSGRTRTAPRWPRGAGLRGPARQSGQVDPRLLGQHQRRFR